MTFPYPILHRTELIQQMNNSGKSKSPFFFIVDFMAQNGYLIKYQDLDDRYIRFQLSDESVSNLEKSSQQPFDIHRIFIL